VLIAVILIAEIYDQGIIPILATSNSDSSGQARIKILLHDNNNKNYEKKTHVDF
jgi:hypothetical protein